MGIPAFSLNLKRKAFSFSPLTMIFYGLFIHGLFYADVLSYFSCLLRVFIMKRVKFCQMLLWHLLRQSWFLSFILLMWCITLNYLYILNHYCIPVINSIWSWWMILLMCCWIPGPHWYGKSEFSSISTLLV